MKLSFESHGGYLATLRGVYAPSGRCPNGRFSMSGRRYLRRAPLGFWLPAMFARTNKNLSGERVFATHRDIFPELPDDLAEVKRLLRGLSRTDTLLWCARLNLLMGHPTREDPRDVQRHCVWVFFKADEAARLDRVAQNYGGPEHITVFFRGQLLELLRWTSLFSKDKPGDGTTFDDPSVRRCFARAALLASEYLGSTGLSRRPSY